MRAGRVLAAFVVLGAAGCADKAVLTPVNAQAQAVGSPRISFFRGFAGFPMKVTMPDGENLPGTFSVDEGGAAAAPGGPGNLVITARGPRTTLICHGNMVAGHGTAECRDQNGAIYRADI